MGLVLVLNASPGKEDAVTALLRAVAEGAARNHKVTWVDAADLRVQPCSGCLRCRSEEECVLPEDDAHRLSVEVRRSAGLAVGAPALWGDVSGQFKALLDRIVPAFVEQNAEGKLVPRHRGKRAVIVTASYPPPLVDRLTGESWAATRALRKILRQGGYELASVVVKAGTGGARPLSPGLVERAREVGRRL